MNLHILGICGTFMGSLALLARELGHRVSGCDQNVYPPMSTQLEEAGVSLDHGFDPGQLPTDCDTVIVGNALSRGNPMVEHLLDHKLSYTSGPQWLGDHLLTSRRVIAVAGTHGKTSTACMIAHILDQAGLAPGFLIGGIPGNFPRSARLGGGDWFVVEADEYDTAFFDKRSKFVHYHPDIAVLNNLEFDHADIFADLAAIQTQFHHLIRLVPSSGLVISPADCPALDDVLQRGLWSKHVGVGNGTSWRARPGNREPQRVDFNTPRGDFSVDWSLFGQHNVDNALTAICAAAGAGVAVETAVQALRTFRLPKRRQQILASHGQVRIVDDFAHHPTAIAATLEALRQACPAGRLLVALEPRSNTMQLGIHNQVLPQALAAADYVWVYANPDSSWDPASLAAALGNRGTMVADLESLPDLLVQNLRPDDLLVFMSNGGFGGVAAATADLWINS